MKYEIYMWFYKPPMLTLAVDCESKSIAKSKGIKAAIHSGFGYPDRIKIKEIN